MKKQFITLIAVLVGFVSAQAQQLPLYTQIYNNEFLYNPSFTLMEDFSSLTAFYRQQWVDIDQSPVTRGVVFQTPLKKEKIGLGLNLINDVNGMFNRTGGYMTYSYSLDLNTDHHILLGLTAGYMQTAIDFDFETDDPIIIGSSEQSPNSLDATFGLGYKWDKLKVGMAVPHLFDELFNPFEDNADNRQIYFNRRHFLGSASYNFEFGDFEVKPTALVRYTPNAAAPLIEGNVLLTYKEMVWLAGNYRHGSFAGVGLGAIMSKRLNIGYSYDFTTNDFGTFGGATHEITIGLKLNKVKEDDFDNDGPLDPNEPKPWDEDLAKLKAEVLKLNKQLKEQKDTLDDHDRRIEALENQRDSLDKLIKEKLENLPIGNAYQDVRDIDNPNGGYPGGNSGGNPGGNSGGNTGGDPGNNGWNSGNNNSSGSFTNQIISDDPEAPYGRRADGTPIGKNERYTGQVYKDKSGKVPLTKDNKTNKFYNERGELIPDISKHTGPVYNKNNELIDYVKNGGDNASLYRPYSKEELVNDGISYMAPGNYVVIGSFRNKEYALARLQEVQAAGNDQAGVVYNNIRRYFYVYSLKTDDFDESINTARSVRASSVPDAWIHIILSR
ncbi:MAG: PorP/SprF family type IX secretion system membrane protein [Bacteroidetes bacterium]|nr:PorP/SprF family type IX secretion system membrane protein [Bacteroidota bacterium]